MTNRMKTGRWVAGLMVMMTAAVLTASCRKPLPAEPLDIRRPPFDADVVIRALDLTTTVPGLDVELYDPDGQLYTGTTDSTGVLTFDFPDMTRGLWRAFIPEQMGRYYNSEIVFNAKGGVNDVTFQSQPRLVLSPITSPVTYAYSTDTFIQLKVDYDQGGALRVPVSITASALPEGWNVSYPVKLGKETNSGTVSIAIPAGQYRQPVFDLYSYAAGSTLLYAYTSSNPNTSVTIRRGFPVTLFLEFSWSSTFVTGVNRYNLVGSYMFYQTNGGNIPWSGTLRVGRPTDTSAYFSAPISFVGGKGGNWGASIIQAEGDNELTFTVNINSPEIGGYNKEHRSGIRVDSAGSHITRVPESAY